MMMDVLVVGTSVVMDDAMKSLSVLVALKDAMAPVGHSVVAA